MSVRQRLHHLLPTLVWAGVAGAILFAVNLRAQPPATAVPPQGGAPEPFAARQARMSAAADAKGLAEPYKGITTSDGKVATGLFPIKSTGVSTEPVRKAATAFLAALTPDQRVRTAFGVDDPEWRKWMNQHFYKRQGVSFGEMAEPQREAAIALMKASLSAKGLQLTRDIMRLNTTLAELNDNNFEEYGEGHYYITVMGAPDASGAAKEPWGWQLDGHHLIVNYFVLGDQVVMTPAFFGSEPVIATAGKYKGLSILQDEQTRALAFVNSLTEAQRAKAILQVSKTANQNVSEAWKDNVTLDYAGVRASDLTAAQQSALLDLANQYIGNMDAGHAKVKLEEVRRHLADTHFAWIGGTAPESVFYYRIHSPVILIEFDHQTAIGMRRVVADPKLPLKEHIHTVMRTPNGNDYGKDLLRQHYEAHKNDPSHGHQE